MSEQLRKIGDIARSTGLTIRTLHYYEEIGLLAPTDRTDAGHRLYGPDAVERLYHISLLRDLGLPLDSVRAGLDERAASTHHLVAEHLAVVEDRLADAHRLRSRLLRLAERLHTTSTPDADGIEDVLDIMEEMAMTNVNIDRRIAILVYDDIEGAFEYLVRVFGFGPGEITRDGDGNVVHGSIQAGDGEFWLHRVSPEFGLGTPRQLGGASGSMAVLVDDVDEHFRHARSEGADVRYEPMDQPYGYREYGAVDPEGHLWSFMKPLDEAVER